MIASAKVMSRVSFAEFGIINYGKSTIFSEKVSERMKKVPFDLQLFSSFALPPPLHQSISSSEAIKFYPLEPEV